MRPLVMVALLAGAGAATLAETEAPPPAPLQRSVTSSKQFYIYFNDRTVRSKLARKVEDIKTHWLETLKLKDHWKAPIIIRLVAVRPARSPRLRTSFFESDNRELKLQVDVYEPSAVQGAEFEIEICRALCLELGYRGVPPKAGKSFTQPPAWLLDALVEDARARSEGVSASIYNTIIERGPPPKLEAFLRQNPDILDATSRALYRAQALGLLRALMGTAEGPKRMVEYLSGLPKLNANDAKGLLAAFPGLDDNPAKLNKLWVLAIANVSATDRIRPLSVAQTQKELSQIMSLSAPEDPKKPNGAIITGPAAMPAVARTDGGRFTLRQKSEELLRLEVRAHPLLRPMIGEYRRIASELTIKPRKNVTGEIAKNMELTNAVIEKSQQVEDYLNWYEAAKIQTSSGEFDALPLQNPDVPDFNARNDSVTRYMDDIEERGW